MRFHDSFLKIIDSDAKQKIVSYLLKHDNSASERELATLAGVSHMTVNRILHELEDWNFVKYQRVGRAHVWQINPKSYAYSVLSEMLGKINEFSCTLKELAKDILQGLPKKRMLKVVLFGSIIRKEERADSDIDVFILVKNQNDVEFLEEEIEPLSSQCLEKYGNKFSPYILTEKEFQQKKDLKIYKEIEKGIQLYPEIKG